MSKKLLMTRDRIILHLSRYSSRELIDYSSPKELTQEGIGESVCIGRNNVPRETKKLIEEGLIDFKKVRVNGFRNKRTIYFLTKKGVEEARHIKDKIKDLYITIIDFSGEKRNIMVKNITKELGIDFITAALYLNKDKVLDLVELMKKRNKTVQIIDMNIKIKNFYGRRDEIRRMREWLDSKKRILLITGIPGIGKTTLMNKFVNNYLKRKNLIWIQIDEWITNIDIIMKLAFFFSKLDKYDLEKYIKSSLIGFEKGLKWGNIYHILRKSLKNEFLIFDGVENANPEVKTIISRLISLTSDLGEFRIVLIGTRFSQIVPANKMLLTEEIYLGDLGKKEVMDFLSDNGISLSEAAEIYENYRGIPLVLELLAKNENKHLLKRYFVKNVIYDLNEEERKAVEIASIFRRPFKKEIFLLYNISYTTVYSLLNKNIFKEVDDDRLAIHTLIKDFIYKNMPIYKKRKYHRFVASYLEENGDFLGAVYHYTHSNDIIIANRILTENYKKYLTKGKVETIRHLALNLLTLYEDFMGNNGWYLYGIIGDTYEICGNWERALDYYLKARDLSKNRDIDFYANSLIKIGEMMAKRGDYKNALTEITKGIKYLDSVRDLKILSRLKYIYGFLSLRIGNLDSAKEYFEESLQIGEKIMDYDTLGYAHNGLGIYYHHHQKNSSALENFNRAKKYFEASRNLRGLVKAISNIGNVYYDMKDSKAEDYFREALSIVRRAGDLWQIGVIKLQLGNYYTYIERYDLALRNLNESERIIKMIGANDILPTIYMGYALLFYETKNLKKAKYYLDKAIKLSLKTGNKYRAINYAKYAIELFNEKIDITTYREIIGTDKTVQTVISSSTQ